MINQEKMSNEIRVGLQILESEHPTFSELVKILDGRITKNEISKSLDRLNDLGLIKEDWIKRDECWRREILISKESVELFKRIKEQINTTDKFMKSYIQGR